MADKDKQDKMGADPDELTPRNVVDGPDFRAGAGGVTDDSAGSPGGTMGTGGTSRDEDR